jgi:hypothetical protein
MNFLQTILLWLGRTLGIIQPPSEAAGDIAEARTKFINAYNNQDYIILCELFHESAKFRGSVHPERWTFSRDSIITERYMSSATCTEILAGATATPREGTRSVGSMTLNLTSGQVSPIGSDYAVDTGIFRMGVKAGYEGTPTSGPYVIVWRREAGAWTMIHIDMHP